MYMCNMSFSRLCIFIDEAIVHRVGNSSKMFQYGLSQISTTRKVINQSQPGQFPMNSMLLHAVLYQVVLR